MEPTAIVKILDRYCIARSKHDTASQLEAADIIVDEVVPALIALVPRRSAVVDLHAAEEETLG